MFGRWRLAFGVWPLALQSVPIGIIVIPDEKGEIGRCKIVKVIRLVVCDSCAIRVRFVCEPSPAQPGPAQSVSSEYKYAVYLVVCDPSPKSVSSKYKNENEK